MSQEPTFLPHTEEEAEVKEPSLEDLLSGAVPEFHRYILKSYETKQWVGENKLSVNELILLQALMSGIIGTGAQRGSITRILSTLKDKYPEPHPRLMSTLHRAAVAF